MFTRKPKNALESVVFTAGKIIEHHPHGNDHFVELVDYCGKTMNPGLLTRAASRSTRISPHEK